MLSRKLLAVLMVGVFALAGCSAPATEDEVAVEDDGVIKIGYIGPLTGGLASVGVMEQNVINDFLEVYPEWDGREVEVIFEDGQCNGQPAANAAQKLINVDGVELILGAGCSGETLAAAPIANEAEVVLFSSVSTSPEVTDAGDFVFRNAPSDANSSVIMTQEVANQGYEKVAIISEQTDFGAAYHNSVEEQLADLGIEVVVSERFPSEVTDFRTVLQSVSENEADVILNLANSASAAGFIVKQAAELGLNLPVYGTDVMSGAEYTEIAGEAAVGTFLVMTAADTSDEDVLAFLDAYEAKYGEKAPAEAYALFDQDRMHIVMQAIEAVGYDGPAIRDYLYEMEPYDGLSGSVEFDENGDSSVMPTLNVYGEDGTYSIVE
jgi:branched-chain amino acid transport system substrate-binding protein